jgi:hypothetical protein
MNFKTLDEFYNISTKTIQTFGATALLNSVYNSSLVEAFQAIYPYHQWLAWKFGQNVHTGFWDKIDNQRDFLNWLGGKLQFKHMDDWYNVTWKQIKKNGGRGLLDKYGDSPSKLIISVYIQYPWKESKFTQRNPKFTSRNKPAGYWNSKDNQRNFLDTLAKQLNFKQQDDWYKVTIRQILENGGGGLLTKYGYSLSRLITSVYNTCQWDPLRFTGNLNDWFKRWMVKQE